MIRTVILYFEYRNEQLFIPLLLLMVLFQMEEALNIIYNRKDKYVFDIMYAQTVFINIFLVPQIIVVFVWMYFSALQTAFFLVLPCFLLLSFYLNLIWVISLEFDPKDYFGTLLIFKELYTLGFQFVGFVAMIFFCRMIENSFFYLVIMNTVLSVVMSVRFISSPLYIKGSKNEIAYYFFLLFFSIFFHSGCDFRKIKQEYNVPSIKQFRVKNLNTLLTLRFIQTLYLLSVFIISISQDMNPPKGQITYSSNDSYYFSIFVIIFVIASLLIQAKDIWHLILKPELQNQQCCYEIDSINQLIKFNSMQKTNQLDCSHVQYISFFFPNEEVLINQDFKKEFDYCLLFNFNTNVDIQIPLVGERVQITEDQINQTVFFKRMIDIQHFEHDLQYNEILPLIDQIKFEFNANLPDLVELMKILSTNSYQIYVKSLNMPNQMITMQSYSFTQKYITILHQLAFDKLIMAYIPINPYLAFYDLYEI